MVKDQNSVTLQIDDPNDAINNGEGMNSFNDLEQCNSGLRGGEAPTLHPHIVSQLPHYGHRATKIVATFTCKPESYSKGVHLSTEIWGTGANAYYHIGSVGTHVIKSLYRQTVQKRNEEKTPADLSPQQADRKSDRSYANVSHRGLGSASFPLGGLEPIEII